MSDEMCARCHEVGEDRRTLRMSCFVRMEEMGLPFEQQIVFNTDHSKVVRADEPVSISLQNGTSINITAGTVTTKEKLTPQGLYTLRVCKRCRGDWLDSIKEWFYDEKVKLQARINELEAELRAQRGESGD